MRLSSYQGLTAFSASSKYRWPVRRPEVESKRSDRLEVIPGSWLSVCVAGYWITGASRLLDANDHETPRDESVNHRAQRVTELPWASDLDGRTVIALDVPVRARVSDLGSVQVWGLQRVCSPIPSFRHQLRW